MTQNLAKVFIKLVRNIKTMEFYFDEKLEFTIILVNEEQTVHFPIP